MHIIGIQCSVYNYGNTPILLERADLVIDFIGPDGPWHFSLDHATDKVIEPFSIDTYWDEFLVPKQLFGLVLPKKGATATKIKFQLKNFKGKVRERSLRAVIFLEVGQDENNIEKVLNYTYNPIETNFKWRFWEHSLSDFTVEPQEKSFLRTIGIAFMKILQ